MDECYISKVKVTMNKLLKYVSGPYSLLQCWIMITFNTIVVHDPRVCHFVKAVTFHELLTCRYG